MKRERGTQADYARHRKARGLPGHSREAVSQAVRSGRIRDAVGKDGLVDFRKADRLWEGNTAHEKRPPSRASRNGSARPVPLAATATLAGHRATHEEWKSKTAELEYRRRAGELVDREEVEREAQASAHRARQRLELIPDRLSGLISAEAYQELRKEIRIACGELAADAGAIERG